VCAPCGKCICHKMAPLMIVLIGLLFLLGELGTVSAGTVSMGWPILLIIAGGSKLCQGMCKCCKPC